MSDELVIFGKPFPSIENDNKNYVPIWKQKATSSKGTKRFHGAFEGGFSAGYFNTVGSREGWKPSEFVSSRDKRYSANENDTNRTIEDYMDEDDLAEYNYKEIIFTGSNKSNNIDDTIKYDPLESISKYLKASVKVDNSSSSKKVINEAFSGGGAWDEDDERPEFYEKEPDLHKISGIVDSIDSNVEDSLVLDFGNFMTISKQSVYSCPNLPDNYVPRKIKNDTDKNIWPDFKATHKFDSKFNLPKGDLDDVDEKTASAALKGFMPFIEDPEKQTRYTRYLRYCVDKLGKSDAYKKNLYLDEKEREEFIMSAQIFKPSSSIISARFESSSNPLQPQIKLKAGLSKPDPSKKSLDSNEKPPVVHGIIEKSSSSETAARRISYLWIPNALLCKRFNVTPPDTEIVTFTESKKVKPILDDEAVEKMVNIIMKDSKHKFIDFESSDSPNLMPKDEIVSALPADDLFEEIFGSNSQSKTNRMKAMDYFD